MTPERIICHWTAGGHLASDHDRCSYHYLIEHHTRDPEDPDDDVTRVISGVPVERNMRRLAGLPSYCCDAEHGYAAHTLGFNSGSVGVSLCGMRDATDYRPARPVDPGSAPITARQVRSLIGTCASLLAEYDLEVSEETLFTHAEAEWLHDRPQRGKWDITWVPYRQDLGPREVGPWIREQVGRALRGEPIEEIQ